MVVSEVPFSNLGRNTDNPDWHCLWISWVSVGKYWNSTLNQATTIFFYILSNPSFDAAYCALLTAMWRWTSEQIQAERTTWTVLQLLLVTGQHVNPAGNAMDAHVQDFLVNDELLLSQPGKHSHSALAHLGFFGSTLCLQSVCSIELAVAPTENIPATLRTAPDTPPSHSPSLFSSRGDHLAVCGLYLVLASLVQRQ